MRAVKAGDYLAVKDFLEQNKYFVFEYDPVSIINRLNLKKQID